MSARVGSFAHSRAIYKLEIRHADDVVAGSLQVSVLHFLLEWLYTLVTALHCDASLSGTDIFAMQGTLLGAGGYNKVALPEGTAGLRHLPHCTYQRPRCQHTVFGRRAASRRLFLTLAQQDQGPEGGRQVDPQKKDEIMQGISLQPVSKLCCCWKLV